MTMMGPGAGGKRAGQVGETVASFPTYEAAQKAVSTLIAADVPARDIAIVGLGLRSIERVTGRLGYATAARSGAINGLLLGLFFSAILVLGSPSVPMQAFVGVLFVGIAIGMLMSLVTYSFVRRRRDYASVMQVVADHYDVTVDSGTSGKARQVLGRQPLAPAEGRSGAGAPVGAPAPGSPAAPPAPPTPPAPGPAEPPRYGERIDPPTAPEPGEPAPGPDPDAGSGGTAPPRDAPA